MKVAIISDTHFGDPKCQLVPIENGTPELGKLYYKKLLEAIGEKQDYLILLGDIIDQAIASYSEGLEAAKIFFRKLHEDDVAKTYIYVSGNHDFDIWSTVEYEVNVIRRVRDKKPPRNFQWSVPAVLDDRPGKQNPEHILPSVSVRKNSGSNETQPYGGLFLDEFATPQGEKQNFVFAYPNVYLVQDDGQCVLLTHGHYFEPYWTILSKWMPRIVGSDLRDTSGRLISDVPSIKNLVALNFPQCQLSCSGVGQAGPLTSLVRKIQAEAKAKDLKRISKYLNNLDNEIDSLSESPGWKFWKLKTMAGEACSDLLSNELKKKILKGLENTKYARDNENYLDDPVIEENFLRYFAASLNEIAELNATYQNLDIPDPKSVIFGHTHRPVNWGNENVKSIKHPIYTRNIPIRAYNSGGWLNRSVGDKWEEFCGATVFKYSTKNGFKDSTLILRS